MLRPIAILSIALLGLTACGEVVVTNDRPSQPAPAPSPSAKASGPGMSANQALRSFAEVKRRVEPVAERECRARTSQVNCDFLIVVDERRDQPANAYQTLDRNGRPIITFTIGLMTEARNADELAFVMGHEAAHHIQGHIARQQRNAIGGAVLAGALATLSGGDASAVQSAQRLGAQVGARSYSKDFELEADSLGTVLTAKAGYNPLRGVEFFNRIPDPGDKFLGTHPPNAQRILTVRRTAAAL